MLLVCIAGMRAVGQQATFRPSSLATLATGFQAVIECFHLTEDLDSEVVQ